MAILISKCNFKDFFFYKDAGVVFMFNLLRIVHKDLLLVNVYGPNRDSTEFYCKLNDNAIETGLSDIIMGGDWNLIFNTNMDYCNIIDILITLLDEMFVFERRGYD